MIRTGYILGIDPDIDKSGFTLVDCASRCVIYSSSLAMVDALRYLDSLASSADYRPLVVVLEDSDTATGWHYSRRDSSPVVFAKGRSVGMCHATLRHLGEYAQSCGLECVFKKPLRKVWGKGGDKISQQEINFFMTGFPKRSNPEMRDSALLAWEYAGLPVRVRVLKSVTKPLPEIGKKPR